MSYLNNFSQVSTNNQQSQQTQYITEYPEVFFTTGNKEIVQSLSNKQNHQEKKGLLNSFGISKDMIGQILPLLFGKNSNNNMLTSLLQNGFATGNNNIISNLFNGNKNISEIFSTLGQPNNKNNEKNKKDMPSIIDMSDYKELKS